MIGIEQIATYLPPTRRSNYTLKDHFSIDDHFIDNKIGFKEVAIKSKSQSTVDLCKEAFYSLQKKQSINKEEIQVIIVVTQNPDRNIPHTSAVVHGALDMPERCACFDISLGCSGYVYALSVIQSFMEANKFEKGLLFTADPYSSIIDPNDKNTSLLFGDGASVSLISYSPILVSQKFTFGTIGKKAENLVTNDGVLYMNGRAIFEFAARYIPKDVKKVLEKNNIQSSEEIDLFLMHQGSKYIIDTLVKRLKVDKEKLPFIAENYGNTVSSSIPFGLEAILNKEEYNTILISGFGVGLSWSTTILKRQKS